MTKMAKRLAAGVKLIWRSSLGLAAPTGSEMAGIP